MLCQNCNENEGNVKYTQIVNGIKKEMILCDDCAKRIGFDEIGFNMPISFSNFLGDFFDDYSDTDFLPGFSKPQTQKCEKCGLTFDEFIQEGRFGCDNCYNTFRNKLNHMLKNLHGSSSHIGRKTKFIEDNNIKIENKESKIKTNEESKVEKLNRDLKLAIKEERYEDAAKIRDEIKKIEG